MTRPRVLAIALVVAALAGPAPTGEPLVAWADAPSKSRPSKDAERPQRVSQQDGKKGGAKARREARKLLKKGQALIREKKYDEGIAEIEAAYELDPRVELLYNLGVAHHFKGDKRRAYEYYQQVLAGKPDRKLARLARRFSKELSEELEEDDAAKRRAENEAAKKRAQADKHRLVETTAELDAARAELRDSRAKLTAMATERDALRANASSGGRIRRIVGSALILAGGATAGMGVAYGLVARDTASEVEGLVPGEDQWSDSLREIGEGSDRRFLILSVAGGGALLVGAALYLWGESAAKSAAPSGETLSVTPALGSDLAGLQVSGRF